MCIYIYIYNIRQSLYIYIYIYTHTCTYDSKQRKASMISQLHLTVHHHHHPNSGNPRAENLDFKEFDSSMFLLLRGGIPRSMGIYIYIYIYMFTCVGLFQRSRLGDSQLCGLLACGPAVLSRERR